ncbi:Septin-4 [Sparganum proliferum]
MLQSFFFIAQIPPEKACLCIILGHMSVIPRFGVSNRFRENEDNAPKNGNRFYSGIGGSGDSTNTNSTEDKKSRPTTANGQADDDSRLGFANIPDQMHRKAVKKGFNFTLMIAGESGLGKATLVNSLFMQDLYKDREEVDANDRISKVTKIEKRQIELDERGVKLRLTIVDTPGFNDAVNAEECWKPIEDYIDGTFEQYFKDECGLNRKNIQDNRVHCCLYFISPYGHGLRQVDVEFMRHLQNKVNIVPVIAKADALTASELRDLKDRIMSDLDRYKIDIYRLPECDSDEEEEIKRLDKEIKAVLPFAVIGSNCVIEGEGGKRVRGRQYPWGVVEVENPRHCDFTKLRIFLLKTHMQDLKDMTLEVHYENYRAKYITERMSKRQTDRREAGGAHRTDRENGPGFDAIVDADCLLRQKEEELQRLQHSGAKTMDLTARAKHSDASSLHSNGGGGQNPQSTVSSTRSAMAGPGTLPPKATATGL